ncbi:uncharacterized protein MONBRDRAFT_7421 [Monosiga brevicollis MX1]|uniref:Uncharacterized protein n=1 Tax=Monosiga brevicollis TaxID=81824 RepID=A9UWX4_MONBE|nr:uncharacterized protein MONBRDRAFT_7421 [Monosiga brevicollis MX1]EDQ90117.1 predicted protein [Monosiga brevicollis MX1]|eukprot:XP_001744884.1 hypothetical protein [Monosiga brevicollis MX1]
MASSLPGARAARRSGAGTPEDPGFDLNDFMELVLRRDNTSQTCWHCDLGQDHRQCECVDVALPAADAPSSWIALRDGAGTILAVAAVEALDIGSRVASGAVTTLTNASLGAVVGGIRGALAGMVIGAFWTSVSLLSYAGKTLFVASSAAVRALRHDPNGLAGIELAEGTCVSSRHAGTRASLRDAAVQTTESNVATSRARVPYLELDPTMLTSVVDDLPSSISPALAPVTAPQRSKPSPMTAGQRRAALSTTAAPMHFDSIATVALVPFFLSSSASAATPTAAAATVSTPARVCLPTRGRVLGERHWRCSTREPASRENIKIHTVVVTEVKGLDLLNRRQRQVCRCHRERCRWHAHHLGPVVDSTARQARRLNAMLAIGLQALSQPCLPRRGLATPCQAVPAWVHPRVLR